MTSPVLDTRGAPSLGIYSEHDADPAGLTVAELVLDGSITSATGGRAIEAIAVTNVRPYPDDPPFPLPIGNVQYSLDGGATWLQFPWAFDTGASGGVLLRPTDRIRVVSVNSNNGTIEQALTFRAWDGQTGHAGDFVPLQPHMDGFSDAAETASFTITAINDAPVLSLGAGAVTGDSALQAGGEFEAWPFPNRLAVTQPFGAVVTATSARLGATDDFVLQRLLPDGSLDPAFGQGGTAVIDFGGADDVPHAIALQPDGKIVAVGVSEARMPGLPGTVRIARFNADGSLDLSFGEGGHVALPMDASRPSARDVLVQDDGDIVVTGRSGPSDTFDLMRITPDGRLDETFGRHGVAALEFPVALFDSPGQHQDAAVYRQSDGKYLVTGIASELAGKAFLARFDEDGSVDTSFGGGDGWVPFGVATTTSPASIAQLASGEILVGGTTDGPGPTLPFVARFTAEGTLDTAFGRPAHIEGGAPVVLAPFAHVIDLELDFPDGYGGATLSLARHGGANADDAFAPSGRVSVWYDEVRLAGDTIAHFAFGAGSLTVRFDDGATREQVNEAIASVAYVKQPGTASIGQIQLDWTFSDGNTGAQGTGGELSATASVVVEIVGATPPAAVS